MSARVFVDTNILLYARDSSEPEKQKIAETALRNLWEARTGRISVQVLNEYFVNVTRKLSPGLSGEDAWDDLEALQAWNPLGMDFALLEKAYRIQNRYSLSWWDSLIVAAAERLGCAQILSEDLSATQSYNGIRVVNPFREAIDKSMM